MINKIWIIMIGLGIIYAIISGSSNQVNELILNSPKLAFTTFLGIAPLIIFWSGIMEVAHDSGFLKMLSKVLSPFVNWLFPKDSGETKEYISANIAANMLGLGSAATPLGLAAMKEMQKENTEKEKATPSMTKLLLLNTSGLTLLPTFILSLRKGVDINAIDVTGLIVLATLLSTAMAIFLIKVLKI